MGATTPGKLVISLGTSDTFFAAMPRVVADPDGYGHVFGNPAGGSMSLQCFVNGSLAREAVKDRFDYDWDSFTAALANTPPANHGNLMVPFFRPEISPRIDLEQPAFSGTSSFLHAENPDEVIRACVEGQFLNMKLRTEWMGLDTTIIYLTGGASANDGIAQVVADIFQAEVQRLAVSGSVALGGAIRAASLVDGTSFEALQAVFCKPVPGSAIRPMVGADHYAANLRDFQKLLG
jgi:xylulokinase